MKFENKWLVIEARLKRREAPAPAVQTERAEPRMDPVAFVAGEARPADSARVGPIGTRQACEMALGPRWEQLVEDCGAPPEAFDGAGRALGALLREILLGAAACVVDTRENPLERLNLDGANLDALSRRVGGLKATRPEDPFHRARSLLTGDTAPGAPLSPLRLDGGWSEQDGRIVALVKPRSLVEASAAIAQEAERIILKSRASDQAPHAPGRF